MNFTLSRLCNDAWPSRQGECICVEFSSENRYGRWDFGPIRNTSVSDACHAVSAETAVGAPERMASREPCHTTTWNPYTDPTWRFFAGIWASDEGLMKIVYSEKQLCYLLEG